MLFLLHNAKRVEHLSRIVVDLHKIAVDKPHGKQPASPIRADGASTILPPLAFLEVLALHVNAVAAELFGNPLTYLGRREVRFHERVLRGREASVEVPLMSNYRPIEVAALSEVVLSVHLPQAVQLHITYVLSHHAGGNCADCLSSIYSRQLGIVKWTRSGDGYRDLADA